MIIQSLKVIERSSLLLDRELAGGTAERSKSRSRCQLTADKCNKYRYWRSAAWTSYSESRPSYKSHGHM